MRPSLAAALMSPRRESLPYVVELVGVLQRQVRRPTVFGLNQMDLDLRDKTAFLTSLVCLRVLTGR